MARVSEGTKAERFEFIKNHGPALGIRYLCTWLNVSHQGFYQWMTRKESERAKANRELSNQIETIYHEHDGNYGCPRIHAALRAKGIIVNHKRVERIMRDTGLVGKAAKLYRRKASPERFFMKHPNFKLNEPKPSQINQQWAGDITYLKVANKWRYDVV